MAVSLAITTMFKPNFVMSLCVALGIVLLIDFAASENRDKMKSILSMGSIVVPSLIVLGIQYFLIYVFGNGKSSSGIQIVFFSDLLCEGSWQHMIVKLGRDLAFPCLVLGITFFLHPTEQNNEFFQKHLRNVCFSFLLFLVSLVVFSVFKESGARAAHGNFGWGKRVTYFTMFAYFVPFFFQCMQKYKKDKYTKKSIWSLWTLGLQWDAFFWHFIMHRVYSTL